MVGVRPKRGPPLATALMAPRSVALIGASARPDTPGGRVLRYLRRHRTRARVWPINPSHRRIQGEPALASLAQVPEPVDHAYILVPTEAVPEVVAQCGEHGVACATILADGFAEAGPEGAASQERLLATARAHGMRLLGPNSMGVINLTDRLALSVSAALDAPRLLPGHLAVLSHSGGMLGTLLSRGQARGIGFSKLISIGNEADLGVGEIGDMLVDDPASHAILMFLETIRQPARIEAMARRAATAGKPLIAYMVGRSEAGRESAAAHTGALVGPDQAADAFLRDCGILRVDLLETLFELPALVLGRPAPKARRRRRVAVMTTTGGAGALLVDRLALAGVEAVAPPAAVIRQLARRGIAVGPGRLTDLTLAGARAEVIGPVLDALIASPHSDAVVVVLGSSAQYRAEVSVRPVIERAGARKPLAVFLAPQAERALMRLNKAGVAAFRTPEACADAVRALLDRRPLRRSRRPPIGDPARAASLFRGADAGAALAGFAALGVACVETRVITDLEGLADADRIDFFPAAAKVASPDLAHKAKAGGVILAIPDRAALRRAARRILAAVAAAEPTARVRAILVQPMETGIAEALVGYRVDPRIGPVVVLAPGGAAADLYRDMAVRRAPVALAQARAMIEEVRGLAPLGGDKAALARAICAVSDLARLPDPGVRIAEINPLIVKADGQGVIAVDGLVVPGRR